ncbi:hypothetical protein AAHC03_019368 [Spirometra sp. Aus1]
MENENWPCKRWYTARPVSEKDEGGASNRWFRNDLQLESFHLAGERSLENIVTRKPSRAARHARWLNPPSHSSDRCQICESSGLLPLNTLTANIFCRNTNAAVMAREHPCSQTRTELSIGG